MTGGTGFDEGRSSDFPCDDNSAAAILRRLKIASRPQAVEESVTLAISARAAALRAEGVDVLSLAAGEPDFAPAPSLEAAAHAFLESGVGRYTATSGTPELRALLAKATQTGCDQELTSDNILVTAGTKPAIHIALLALVEPGDEVVVLAPYWVSYPHIVRLAGGVPRIFPCSADDGFVPDFGDLERELARPECRALIVNSPNNPTGRVYSSEVLRALHDLCREHDVTILSDEIYAEVTDADTDRVPSPSAFDTGLERTIVLDGLSKSHAVPGWRLGWMIGPPHLIAAAGKLQSQLLGNACAIAQAAAMSAFTDESRAATRSMVAAIVERRSHFSKGLEWLPEFELLEPMGAFYAFPAVHDVLARLGIDDTALASRLLVEARVAIVPGTAFGAPGHLRFSLTRGIDVIDEALHRVRAWLDDHLP
ncbi:MAG: aminotransferase class I/II-fold pyridoxal phosphate-dependent enzyme [Planctomycetes bacterium]|nr:aminotransferase class I/II-fold pyridoxal phosphate-dependent enzyme [Planctomycetota bacterium]